MLSEELITFLEMSYDEMCLALKDKYGPATEDYYRSSDSKSRNKKTSRVKEGLFCHHIGEIEVGLLADPSSVRKFSFEYQKAENLVYCNYFEHLILHLKLNILDGKRWNLNLFFTRPGLWWIVGAINDLYRNQGSQRDWEQKCYEEIKDRKQEYFLILRGLMTFNEKYIKADEERKTELRKSYLKSATEFYPNILWDELKQELELPITDDDIIIAERIRIGAKKDWETLYTRQRIVADAAIYDCKKVLNFEENLNKGNDAELKTTSSEEVDSELPNNEMDENCVEEFDDMRQRTILISVVIITILIILVLSRN